MIISFRFGNFRSFQESQELSFEPAGKIRAHPNHLYELNIGGKSQKVLRTALIYGANASGKSNLLRALDFMVGYIQGAYPFQGKQISKLGGSKPTEFSMDFVAKEGEDYRKYRLSFVLGPTTVESEILEDLTGRRKLVYEINKRQKDGGQASGKPGSLIPVSQFKAICEVLPSDRLFLTDCRNRNIEALKPIHEFFNSYIRGLFPEGNLIVPIEGIFNQHEEFRNFLNRIMRWIDNGVDSIELIEDKDHFGIPAEELDRIVTNMRTKKEVQVLHVRFGPTRTERILVEDGGEGVKIFRLALKHRSKNGSIAFDLNDESNGTQRMVDLSVFLWKLISENRPIVWFADELDRALHPCILENLLRECLSTNKPTQMVFSLHQTHLIDLNLFRFDEIWFTDKNDHGSSELKSLYDYQLRGDSKNLDKDYLNGIFGCVPRYL